jgi:hypothetical protein
VRIVDLNSVILPFGIVKGIDVVQYYQNSGTEEVMGV